MFCAAFSKKRGFPFDRVAKPFDQNIMSPQLKSCFDRKIKVIFAEAWHLNIDKIL
jgi:hypothetical protein